MNWHPFSEHYNLPKKRNTGSKSVNTAIAKTIPDDNVLPKTDKALRIDVSG